MITLHYFKATERLAVTREAVTVYYYDVPYAKLLAGMSMWITGVQRFSIEVFP